MKISGKITRALTVPLLMLVQAVALAGSPPAPLSFQTLVMRDGLPSSDVYKLTQDQAGFIWIATHDGLARYDGIDFLVFRQNAKGAGASAGNDIETVLADREGRIWCGGEASGLLRLDPGAKTFFNYRHVPNDIGTLGNDDVFAIAEDAKGTIWVGTYLGGLNALQPDGRFLRVDHDSDDPASLRSSNVLSLAADKKNRIWIGTDSGLDVRDGDGVIHHVVLPGLEDAGGSMLVNGFSAESDGGMLVATDKGIARIDQNLQFVEIVGTPNLFVSSVARLSADTTWIGTSNGLLQLDSDGTRAYRPVEGVVGTLPGRRVFDILHDHEGGVWFGMVDGGVARLPPHWTNFSAYRHVPGDDASLAHGDVRAIGVGDDGSGWAVTSTDGLDRIDAVTGKVTHYGDRLGSSTQRLLAVLPVADTVWVGRRHGLQKIDLHSGTSSEFPVADNDPNALAGNQVNQLLLGAEGSIWALLGTIGIARIDPATHAVRNYLTANQSIENGDIRNVTIDSHGMPWAATTTGIERLDRATDRFRRVAGAPTVTIDGLAFAADGSVWMHVPEAIERYQIDSEGLKLLQRFPAGSDLFGGYVQMLHIAADGDVWIGSVRGLWRLHPETGSLRRFDEFDGLPSGEFEPRAMAVSRQGMVWAGTRSGAVAFDPGTIQTHLPTPTLQIVSATTRREGATVTLDPGRQIDLGYADRDLSFAVRLLSFANLSANRYRFRLEGFDKDWIDTGNSGQQTYSQLSAGNYSLHVQAMNAEASWVDLASPLSIQVVSAPWATPWAYALYALAVLGSIALVFRSYRLRIRRGHALQLALERQRAAEQVGESKSAFLATMAHEIRTPLTGVLGMTDLLLRTDLNEKQRGQADAIRTSGELLMRVVNDSLDLARIEAGKLALEARAFSPGSLLAEVATMCQGMADKKSLALSLNVDPDVPPRVCGDPLRVKQVLLNLVGNAMKFTEHGRVVIGLAPEPGGRLRFRVEDSGPGMSADIRERVFQRFEQSAGVAGRFGGSGLGLAICRELVELMGGEICVNSQLGRGSEFTVDLPLPALAERESSTESGDDNGLRSGWTPAPPSTSSAGRALDILLVEDDETVAKVIVGLLDHVGHRCFHAANGLIALAELSRARFDVALIDLDLPGIDGLRLARMLRVRRDPSGWSLPLIAVTARAGGNEESQVRAAGMDGFLRKPLVAERLYEAIDSVVRAHVDATRRSQSA
ncbi:MAG: ATP-binding protein [Dokdonella sp.]